jgi:hypothetical protein
MRMDPFRLQIHGVMYILNEDEEKTIDFTMDDFKYLIHRCKDVTYFQRLY